MSHMPHFYSRFLFLLALLLIAGCSQAPAESSSPSSTKEQVEEAEARFVVFSPAIGVMLRDLGFEDSIVGKHAYDTALSDSIAVVGSHIDIDYEMLITLSPSDMFFERNSVEIPDRVRVLADENGWQIWTYELKTLDDIAMTIDDLYLKLVGFKEKQVTDDNFLNVDIDPTTKFDVELPSARLASSWSPIGRAARGAGRTLILASVEPSGAMGPGSFHAQLIDRLGIEAAIVDGGMWQELDFEDIIDLAPDSILVFMPTSPSGDDLIGEPEALSWAQIQAKVGGVGSLPIPAVEHHRIAIIEHPLGLLPSSSLGQVADEIAEAVRAWHAQAP